MQILADAKWKRKTLAAKIRNVKPIPTQTERTILLWSILAFMALLVPQCWSTARGQGNESVCLLWISAYASLLLFTCMVAGTKRQPIVAIVSLLSLTLVFAFSSVKIQQIGPDLPNIVGADATGLAHSTDAIGYLIAVCLISFAISFAASYLLDRFVRPFWGTEASDRVRAAGESSGKTENPNRFRFLIVVAVVLFLFQATKNVLGTNSSVQFWGQAFLIPIGFLCVATLCCGLICRIRIFGAWAVGAFMAMVSASAVVSIAVRKSETIDAGFMLSVLVACAMLIAIVFALLGNSKRKIQSSFSWLSIATLGIGCGLAFMSSKYDLHSLLLGDSPLDFPRAAFLKTLNTDPQVQVTHSRRSRSADEFTFVFAPDADSTFFDQFDASGISNTGNRISIIGMNETVDLAGLKNWLPVHIHLYGCRLSSQQLAEISQLGIPVYLLTCEFVPGETVGVRREIGPQIYLMATDPGETSQFMAAIDGFEMTGDLKLWAGGTTDADIEAILDSLDSNKTEYRINLQNVQIPASRLLNRKNLECLLISGCDFSVSNEDKPLDPDSFAMVLKNKVGVQGRIENLNVFWGLALGTIGEFQPYLITEVRNEDYDDAEALKNLHFAYELTKNSDEIEKLWSPWCDADIISSLGKMKSLTALSFDIEWLGNPHLSSHFSSQIPGLLDVSELDQLQNLTELYFSPFDQVDVSFLSSLSKMETIQFTSSSTGFHRDLFPKLKEVRVLLDKPIKNGLMKEFAAVKSLESIVVVDIHATNFTEDKFLKQAVPYFKGKVDVRVIDIEDAGQLAPDDFNQHRLGVRKKCIEQYLD